MPEKSIKAKDKGRRNYSRRYMFLRRRMVKQKLVAYKGGSCVICGYKRCADALDLHHLDEHSKSFGLDHTGLTRRWPRVKKEADKCVLLCANCHREFHVGKIWLPKKVIVEPGLAIL